CIVHVSAGDDVLMKADADGQVITRAGVRMVERLAGATDAPPRIILVQGTAAIAGIQAEVAPHWREHVRIAESITSRGRSILTATAHGADKGSALRIACEHLGIDPAEVI